MVVLVIVACIFGLVGGVMITSTESAVEGLGLIGLACFWAILGAMRQASDEHRKREEFLTTLLKLSRPPES